MTDKDNTRFCRGQAAIDDGMWYAAGVVTAFIIGYNLLVIL